MFCNLRVTPQTHLLAMEAPWEVSQKKTKLLKDANGYVYHVHWFNADKTKVSYRCVKGKVHFKTLFADSDAEYVVIT